MSNSYIVSAEWLVTGSEKEVQSVVQATMKVSTNRSASNVRTVPLSLNYRMISNQISSQDAEKVEGKKTNQTPKEKDPQEWPQSDSFVTDVIWDFPTSPLQ